MTQPPALARSLGLSPHPEGGWYRRIYTSPVSLDHPTAGGIRASATLIHYLLGPGEQSEWHRVASDEVWLWQQGGPLLLQTSPPGPAPSGLDDHLLGPGTYAGTGFEAGAGAGLDAGEGAGAANPEPFHVVVPAGHWQRAEPAAGREVLVSCLVTPGFDFADFSLLRQR